MLPSIEELFGIWARTRSRTKARLALATLQELQFRAKLRRVDLISGLARKPRKRR